VKNLHKVQPDDFSLKLCSNEGNRFAFKCERGTVDWPIGGNKLMSQMGRWAEELLGRKKARGVVSVVVSKYRGCYDQMKVKRTSLLSNVIGNWEEVSRNQRDRAKVTLNCVQKESLLNKAAKRKGLAKKRSQVPL